MSATESIHGAFRHLQISSTEQQHSTSSNQQAMQKHCALPVKPKAVSARSTAARYGERGLEVVPDVADLGLPGVSGKSGKGGNLVLIGATLGIPSTAQQ